MNKLSKIRLGLIMLFLIESMIGFTNALVVDSVTIDTLEMIPGETTEVEIGLKNNEDVNTEKVSVSLDLNNLPFAPVNSSSEFTIDEIKEGKTKYARFKLVVLSEAEPQIYKIPIKISYKEEDGTEVITKNSLISLRVVSKPILGINKEEGLLLKGKTNEVVIKVINKGLSDVKFLELEIPISNNYEIVSTNKVYVGDLDSDDFDNVDFKIFFNNNVQNKINFPVKLSYKDSLNNEYSENINLQIDIYTRERAIELGLMKKSYTVEIIVLIILLLIFFLLYRYIKRSLRKKED